MGIEIKDDEEDIKVEETTEVPATEKVAEFLSGTIPSHAPTIENPEPTKQLTASEEIAALKLQLAGFKQLLDSRANAMQPMDVASLVTQAVQAAAIGLSQAQLNKDAATREALILANIRKTKRCPVCNLPETACGGAPAKSDGTYDWELNHIQAYVGPQNEEYLGPWDGITIRGVQFKSQYFGQLIIIPKKSDILASVNHWERNEREVRNGRKGQSSTSARIGSNQTNAQFQHWR